MNNAYIEQKVEQINKEMYGDGTNLGVSQKVAVLWKAHVWLLCTFSAAIGSIVTIGIQKFISVI